MCHFITAKIKIDDTRGSATVTRNTKEEQYTVFKKIIVKI